MLRREEKLQGQWCKWMDDGCKNVICQRAGAAWPELHSKVGIADISATGGSHCSDTGACAEASASRFGHLKGTGKASLGVSAAVGKVPSAVTNPYWPSTYMKVSVSHTADRDGDALAGARNFDDDLLIYADAVGNNRRRSDGQGEASDSSEGSGCPGPGGSSAGLYSNTGIRVETTGRHQRVQSASTSRTSSRVEKTNKNTYVNIILGLRLLLCLIMF